jgi:diguanylate cyclase (GGDEF)-like protein
MRTGDPARFRQSLLRLLAAGPHEDDALLAEIEARRRPGQPLYSSLLHLLTHLTFTEAQARKHWDGIAAHRRELVGALGRDPGLRVAMLDYFVNKSHELKSPKVVEISIFERTERRALTDALTGLFNRAYFLQALRREVYRARRHGLKVSLVLLDLDDFKRLNDTRGHLAGDRVLVKAAAMVGASLRQIDVCARYGGEEFAVILPDTDREGAFVVAERIRARIEGKGRRRRSVPVTVSGGVATFPDDGLDCAHLIREADRLLYRAKADGKNRIVHADPHRRRHERQALQHPVDVLVTPRRVIAAVTQNVSAGGVLLAAPEAVAVGSRIGLVVRPPSRPAVTLQVQVVRADRAPQLDASRNGHGYDLGLRLLSDPRRNRALLALRSEP